MELAMPCKRKLRSSASAFIIAGSKLARSEDGGFAVTFSVLLIPLMIAAGMAIDYTRLVVDNRNLQEAVDSAVLAATKPDAISDKEREEIANEFVKSNYRGLFPKTTVAVASTSVEREVSVSAQTSIKSTFMSLRGASDLGHRAAASAKSVFQKDTCVLALNSSENAALSVKGSGAHISANCGVQSNSVSSTGIVNTSNTTSVAKSFCSSGGFTGTNYSTAPKTNCPPLLDPYASLPAPSSSGCDENNYKSSGNEIIYPGVYCGGISITKGSVNAKPGVYVMKDGDLKITTGNGLSGNGVTFYFVGDSQLSITGNGSADISAPKTGPLAGMLFMSHPDAGSGKSFKITGNGNTKLVGITYFPNQLLEIGGNGDLGASSPFMGLVADKIQMHGNGQVQVNFDYKAAGYADIPIPGQSYSLLTR